MFMDFKLYVFPQSSVMSFNDLNALFLKLTSVFVDKSQPKSIETS
jgi:hypothetical protein